MQGGLDLGIDRGRPVTRTPLGDGSSWVDVVEGYVRDPSSLTAHLVEGVEWMQGEVWRFDHFVEERRLGAWVRSDSFHPTLRQAGLHLEAAYRVRFKGVTAVLYRDGSDFQGLHSDREMKWLDDTLIAIVVLGARRPFVLRPRRDVGDRAARADSSQDLVLTPGEGDLLVMGGRCQRDWLHGVPAAETSAARISLTWRWTSRRGPPDTAPSYYDGRHFSDGPRRPGHRFRPAPG